MLSGLVGFGRRTITGLVRTQVRHQRDRTAKCRFYSRDRFDEHAVFDLACRHVEAYLPADAPLVTTMDDSLLRRSGRRFMACAVRAIP